MKLGEARVRRCGKQGAEHKRGLTDWMLSDPTGTCLDGSISKGRRVKG